MNIVRPKITIFISIPPESIHGLISTEMILNYEFKDITSILIEMLDLVNGSPGGSFLYWGHCTDLNNNMYVRPSLSLAL